jgi:hypothetical protein
MDIESSTSSSFELLPVPPHDCSCPFETDAHAATLVDMMLADHAAPVVYEIPLPPRAVGEHRRGGAALYLHAPRGRKGRNIDAATERFVEETRMGTAP